jgi:hypothetical protein
LDADSVFGTDVQDFVYWVFPDEDDFIVRGSNCSQTSNALIYFFITSKLLKKIMLMIHERIIDTPRPR